jgi:hypothetical protein
MNNCRSLSKEEGEYWSDKIFSAPYTVPSGITPSGYGNGYIIRDKFGLPEIYNPNSISRKNINYRFAFSISKNNIKRFENLLNQFLKDGCKHTLYESGNKEYYQNFEYDDLNILRDIEVREDHQTYGVDFVKFTYEFNNSPALATIFFIQTVKDVINIIGEYWGFDKDGREVCSIKYPVGSIVSTKDKKLDFFIESIIFVRENTLKFKELKNRYKFSEELILYNLLEIVKNNNSQVLEFSDVLTTSSDYIIPNRGQRLDELLG